MKRSQFLKDLLAVRPEDTAAAASPSPAPVHVKSGAARSFEEAIGRLVSTGGVVAVDPAAIDRADLADRMEGDDGAAFAALKASIAENGQEVPVLLRPHPTDPARYQTAYGHRRVRAARELGLQVKAVVRPMTDAELVLAQGLENSAREDLTFVEQARFAAAIEAAGHGREVAMRALSVDKTWLSRMLSVMRAVPADVVEAIGRAPGVGARRWIELAEALGAAGAVATVRGLLADPAVRALPSERRFARALAALAEPKAADTEEITGACGVPLGTVRRAARRVTITTDRRFGDWLAARLGELHRRFEAGSDPETGREPED